MEKDAIVTLSQPTSSETKPLLCYLHIKQFSHLQDHSVTGVELMSGSRNVEVYRGEDYVTTCRGSLVEQSNQ